MNKPSAERFDAWLTGTSIDVLPGRWY